MHVFDMQLADCNQSFVLGLSRNVFYFMLNIPTVVIIKFREHSCKCRIYMLLIIIYLHTGNKCFYHGGMRWDVRSMSWSWARL